MHDDAGAPCVGIVMSGAWHGSRTPCARPILRGDGVLRCGTGDLVQIPTGHPAVRPAALSPGVSAHTRQGRGSASSPDRWPGRRATAAGSRRCADSPSDAPGSRGPPPPRTAVERSIRNICCGIRVPVWPLGMMPERRISPMPMARASSSRARISTRGRQVAIGYATHQQPVDQSPQQSRCG